VLEVKARAKAKFKVYPSAYANGYAVQVCKGKMPGTDGKKDVPLLIVNLTKMPYICGMKVNRPLGIVYKFYLHLERSLIQNPRSRMKKDLRLKYRRKSSNWMILYCILHHYQKKELSKTTTSKSML